MALVWTENGSFGLKTATTLVKYILAQLLMHANMIYCLKKRCHFYFWNKFGKCKPILIILSLLYSHIYCWGRWY